MRLHLFAGLALACLSLGGCSALQGAVGFNNALLPQLKPVDVKIHTDTTCGDMAAQVLGVAGGQLTSAAVVSIVQFCERRDATQMLMMDPQGARKALDMAITKAPAVPIAGVAPVTP